MDHLPPSYDTYWHNPLAPQPATEVAYDPKTVGELLHYLDLNIAFIRGHGLVTTANAMRKLVDQCRNSALSTAPRKP